MVHSQFYKIHLPLFVSDGDANGLAELVVAPVYGVFETVLTMDTDVPKNVDCKLISSN